jgi:hypothetical protein
MPSSRILIASNTLGSATTTVTFSSIPSTYTDLVLRMSTRIDSAPGTADLIIQINSGGNMSYTRIQGNGATASSFRSTGNSTLPVNYLQQSDSTSNTFDSSEVYFPSYTSSNNKVISSFGVQETNGTTAYMRAIAHLRSNTESITSLEIRNGGYNFVAGSSFFLYGIKNS